MNTFVCIFCTKKHNDYDDAFDHYWDHMQFKYYCAECDHNLSAQSVDGKKNCSLVHINETIEDEEKASINMWLDKFLTHQKRIQSKTLQQIKNTEEMIDGCPYCQLIAKHFDIRLYSAVNAEQKEDHIKFHLRYNSFECNFCKQQDSYRSLCHVDDIKSHYKHFHGIDVNINNFYHLVTSAKVMKLEKFIDTFVKSRTDIIDRINDDTNMVNIQMKPNKKRRLNSRIDYEDVNNENDINIDAFNADDDNEYDQNSESDVYVDENDYSVDDEDYNDTNDDDYNDFDDDNDNDVDKNDKDHTPLNHFNKMYGIQSKNSLSAGTSNSCKSADASKVSNFYIHLAQNQPKVMPESYFCIFCEEDFTNYEETYKHYQTHINYHPHKCLLCDKEFVDMASFNDHHKKKHPKLEQKYENNHIDLWLKTFISSQPFIKTKRVSEKNATRPLIPETFCPVCVRVYSQQEMEEIEKSRKYSNHQYSKRIDHIHRHLTYEPYQCMLCKSQNKNYFIPYFACKGGFHLRVMHPEIYGDSDRWLYYEKTRSIPEIEEYIKAHLIKINIPLNKYEERPRKITFETDIISKNNSFNMNVRKNIHDGLSLQSKRLKRKNKSNKSLCSASTSFCSNDSNKVTNNQPLVEIGDYFCIFCNEEFNDFGETYKHYQAHVGYYPFKCQTCSEQFVNMPAFNEHLNETHGGIEQEIDNNYCQHVDEWLTTFISSHPLIKIKRSLNSTPVRSVKYCPICVREYTPQQLESFKKKHCSSVGKMMEHIHSHLYYEPYQCTLCKSNGEKYSVPYFESKRQLRDLHVLSKHPELASNDDQWLIFEKTRSIPLVEKYIKEQFIKSGVSLKNYEKLQRKLPQEEKDTNFQEIVSDPTFELNQINFYSVTPKVEV